MKPITLHIPNYFNSQTIDKNRLILSKTKSLVRGDSNNAKFIASLESPKNYQCAIPEIGEENSKIATNRFHKDRIENWELQTKVSGCKVYTFQWNDENLHFRIYWIVLSEEWMVQLVGIFELKYAAFYMKDFLNKGLDTEIDTTFDFSSEQNPLQLFECRQVKEVTSENQPEVELQELIEFEKKKIEKEIFLEKNLKLSNPNFYTVLETVLQEKKEVSIDNFICTNWNMYYDLHNPENFSNPDSTIELEDNSSVFEYYEKPFTDNTKVTITSYECYEDAINLDALKNLINNIDKVEQNLLSFFEHYTFGNGGAYAAAIHFEWAKIEIERLHNTTFTPQEFLKRNLCLININLTENHNQLGFYFKCGWDIEHGIEVIIDEKFECKIKL